MAGAGSVPHDPAMPINAAELERWKARAFAGVGRTPAVGGVSQCQGRQKTQAQAQDEQQLLRSRQYSWYGPSAALLPLPGGSSALEPKLAVLKAIAAPYLPSGSRVPDCSKQPLLLSLGMHHIAHAD